MLRVIRYIKSKSRQGILMASNNILKYRPSMNLIGQIVLIPESPFELLCILGIIIHFLKIEETVQCLFIIGRRVHVKHLLRVDLATRFKS